MALYSSVLVLCAVFLSTVVSADELPGISHGPLLGAVSEKSAALWVRTSVPAEVIITLFETAHPTRQRTKTGMTSTASDNTAVIRFADLQSDSRYRYEVVAGKSRQEGRFTTLGPLQKKKIVRLAYGYGYNAGQDRMEPGTSIFMEMAKRKPDLVLFLGDFPYTRQGRREEIRAGNRMLRSIVGFRELTASTPTYAIYDDHDFGPNNCDGTHENADEALAAFKEYWPNPSYGMPDTKGIYTSFTVGAVEFFLLDGRYQARKNEMTMLGRGQFEWLCRGLLNSRSRYKVLVSGTQFGRVKEDSWGGEYYLGEREKLFKFIVENKISGVFGISGDAHRSDISRLPMGNNRFFYDFTPGALSRKQRKPLRPMPAEMIHSHSSQGDNNMFGEIEFQPASASDGAVIFRSFSAKNGLIFEYVLSATDLAIAE